MALAGQHIQPDRYTVIPRTLVFLRRANDILLLRIRENRGAWSGKYNGIGGHIEAGEDPLSSARREVFEETGLQPTNLWLCGVVHVDTGTTPGIGLYVFSGAAAEGELLPSEEGEPDWVPISRLESIPLVSDLAALIPAVLESTKDQPPFSALTTFDEDGKPIVQFSN